MRSSTGVVAILTVLLLALTLGLTLGSGRPDPYSPLEVARAEALAKESAAEDAWRTAWRPIGLTLQAILGGVLLVGLAAVVITGTRWLDMRARTIYPDAHGVMPAVILGTGREQVLLDTGTLAGPVVLGAAGPVYALPAAEVPRLQGAANQGAAATRMMRAWASRDPGQREAAAAPAILPQLGGSAEYPPIELLTGDPGHVYRLLEEGHGE